MTNEVYRLASSFIILGADLYQRFSLIPIQRGRDIGIIGVIDTVLKGM